MSAQAPAWKSSSRKCPGGGLLQQEVVDGRKCAAQFRKGEDGRGVWRPNHRLTDGTDSSSGSEARF